MKAVVAAFNQEKAPVGAFSVITNLRMELFEALIHTDPSVGITWVDAPTAQYARVHTDHKLRCKVQANPAANIDWLKESVIISSGELS